MKMLNNLIEKHNQGENIKYVFFWGHTPKAENAIDKSCFSQWFPSNFVVDEVTYKTAEHWMMAEKARLFGCQDIREQIIASKTPAEAKKLGRKVTGFIPEVWDEHKFEIVVSGNFHKFSQNDDMKQFLMNTYDRVLVEASPVDSIWGIGLAPNDRNVYNPNLWKGENLLGFALMEVRKKL